MNKQEALEQIKELEKFTKECDSAPKLKRGQLYQHREGHIYVVIGKYSNFTLCCILGGNAGDEYARDCGFDGNKEYFTYLGTVNNLLTIVD